MLSGANVSADEAQEESLVFPGKEIGRAEIQLADHAPAVLQNNVLRVVFGQAGNAPVITAFENRLTCETIVPTGTNLFSIQLKHRTIESSVMQRVNGPQLYQLDIGTAFELMPGEPVKHRLESPYSDQRIRTLEVEAGKPEAVSLEPFEVMSFESRER
jgi:hypothetical protein